MAGITANEALEFRDPIASKINGSFFWFNSQGMDSNDFLNRSSAPAHQSKTRIRGLVARTIPKRTFQA
jgi:hypothetical protein